MNLRFLVTIGQPAGLPETGPLELVQLIDERLRFAAADVAQRIRGIQNVHFQNLQFETTVSRSTTQLESQIG
jgi:5-formaminoimidazole-4-carboxamide-1-beta-D-ribofuranosyl 5'-monophosphate synthetase